MWSGKTCMQQAQAGHIRHCTGSANAADSDEEGKEEEMERWVYEEEEEEDSNKSDDPTDHDSSDNYGFDNNGYDNEGDDNNGYDNGDLDDSDNALIGRDYNIDNTYLVFQTAIYEQFGEDGPFKTGTVTCHDDSRAKSSWRDYVDIHHYSVNNMLSRTEGDDLLALFRKLCARRSVNIPIPKGMRTINDAIKRTMTDGYGIEPVKFPFDPDLLSLNDFPNLKSCIGGFLNPILILSEWLLMVDESDILWEPKVYPTKSGEEYIGHYTSGSVFKTLNEKVKRQYGPDVSVLVFDMNFDAMALDLLGKNNLKPLAMRMKNAVDSLIEKEANIITCAYGPIFPYTAVEMKEMLATKIDYPTKITEALVYLRR